MIIKYTIKRTIYTIIHIISKWFFISFMINMFFFTNNINNQSMWCCNKKSTWLSNNFNINDIIKIFFYWFTVCCFLLLKSFLNANKWILKLFFNLRLIFCLIKCAKNQYSSIIFKERCRNSMLSWSWEQIFFNYQNIEITVQSRSLFFKVRFLRNSNVS